MHSNRNERVVTSGLPAPKPCGHHCEAEGRAEMQCALQRKLRLYHQMLARPVVANPFQDEIGRGPDAAPDLLRVLGHPDQRRRVDALLALGAIFATHGAPDPILSALVQHAQQLVGRGAGLERQAALCAMGRARRPELMDGFVELLAGSPAEPINVACWVLGYGRWQPAVGPVGAVVATHSPETSPAAIWALGQMGHPAAIGVLRDVLRRSIWLPEAIVALGAIGDMAGLDGLVPFWFDSRPYVRWLAISAVGRILRIGSPDLRRSKWSWLVRHLRSAGRDSFKPVAAVALLILAEHGLKMRRADLACAYGLRPTGPGRLGPH